MIDDYLYNVCSKATGFDSLVLRRVCFVVVVVNESVHKKRVLFVVVVPHKIISMQDSNCVNDTFWWRSVQKLINLYVLISNSK